MITTTDFTEIKIQKLTEKATLPTRAHADDAGMDLYAAETVHLAPNEGKIVKTGIAMEILPGFVGMIADRSSLGKKGIKTAGGIVDAGYRGEIGVILWNWSQAAVEFQPGDRIAQMLLIPIATPQPKAVTSLEATTRGSGGFGSTGK